MYPRLLRGAAGICLLAAAIPSLAQVGQSGTVSGVALAPDNTPIAGAAINLSAVDGMTRHLRTGTDGAFSFKDLPSGTYSLQSSAPGFTRYVQPGIAVAVGRNTQLELRFVLPGVTTTVNVTTTPPTIDTSQTSSVVNVDRDRVEELPIPSRNYLSFVALSPQATPANPAVAANSLTQTVGSFGFGGLRPGSNAITIDGVTDSDEYTGSSRTQLSPEAISDFQIVNHGFVAESGGAAGGAIDVQTRMGLDRPHGDTFVFVQNGALNGTPLLELVPYKPDESRIRIGLALGGALQRGKTFYYIAAEQEIAHGQDANDLRPATLAVLNSALAQPGPLHGLSLQNGFFATTDQETELSGRLDRKLTVQQSVMLRYALTNARDVNDAFHMDDLSDRSARGSSFLADNSLNGTLTSALHEAGLNKFNFELAQRRAVERTGDTRNPGVLIPGVALFGTPYEGNNRRFETHLAFGDNLLVQKRRHLFGAGAGVDSVRLRSAVLDGQQGLYVFPDLASFTSRTPDVYLQSTFSDPNVNLAEDRISAYLQDHWTPARSVAIDYGFRYEDNRLPSGLPQHALNLSPRVGVAWSPLPSLVLRSGFGIFYDRFLLSTLNRVLEFDGTRGYSQVVEGEAVAAVYNGSSSAPANVAPSVWTAQSKLHNPYSEVASFSVEQALRWQATVKAEYHFVHGVHLGRSSNTNLLPPELLTSTNAAALGVATPTAQQLNRLVFSPARVNPAYDAINQFATTAASSYSGATVTVNRQFTDDLQILAGYTFSKTFDDASYDTEQPQNPFAPANERAPSLQDQRHRFTLSGLWLFGPDLGDPQDAVKNAHPGALLKAFYGFELAPILSLTSGFHTNPLVGVDSNREHVYPFSARPLGHGRNSLSTPAHIDLDLRVLKMVALGRGHLDIVAESFNLLNHQNIGLLNAVFGSGATATSSFARPVLAMPARRFQFSLDYEF